MCIPILLSWLYPKPIQKPVVVKNILYELTPDVREWMHERRMRTEKISNHK